MVVMDLKEFIKIGYRNYKIDVWPDSFASTEDAEGEFFSKEGKIGLNGAVMVDTGQLALKVLLSGVLTVQIQFFTKFCMA